MFTLLIKVLILALSISTVDSVSSVSFLVMLLLTITFTGLNQYFSNKELVSALSGSFLLISSFLPVGFAFSPLFVFDLAFHFKVVPVVVLTLIFNVFLISLGRSPLLLFVHLVAILMAYMTFEIERLSKTNRNMRDDNFEQKSKLKEQNKVLMDTYDNEVHIAKLQERSRIARDIHDNIGHALSRALLQTGALQATNQDERLQPQLDNLQITLTDSMNSIRNSIHDLKDESIDLESSINGILQGSKTKPHLSYDMTEPVPNAVKNCFLIVLKEAITNTNKHSNATKIDVTVAEHPALFQLLVVDNGTIPPDMEKPGIGLENIKERITELGGYLRTEYRGGFRIFITLPKNIRGDVND